MELQENDDGLVIEKVEQLKYLKAWNNDWCVEILICILKVETAYYALQNLFITKLFIKKQEINNYMVVIRPTLTYIYKV